MKLIVGLGNPGQEYQNTRHNIGFLVLDFLFGWWGTPISTDEISGNQLVNQCKSVSAWKFNKRTECEESSVKLADGETVILAKPQTMMNASGRAVKKLMGFYKVPLESLLVAHDDLDLRLGEYKLQLAKGPKVHNGINSVEKSLRTKDFWRLRVGVDNRKLRAPSSQPQATGKDYVLQNFPSKEKAILEELIKSSLTPIVDRWLLSSH